MTKLVNCKKKISYSVHSKDLFCVIGILMNCTVVTNSKADDGISHNTSFVDIFQSINILNLASSTGYVDMNIHHVKKLDIDEDIIILFPSFLKLVYNLTVLLPLVCGN